MCLFVSLHGIKHILEAIDCVSKWVEKIMFPNKKGKIIKVFMKKNLFSKFRTPMVIISDGGSHFFNYLFKALLEKYGVKYKVEKPYDPQTNGQVEVCNFRSSIFWQRLCVNRMNWARKLDNVLWAYQTIF